MNDPGVQVELLHPQHVTAVEDALADVLVDCVAGGASVGFLSPLAHESARHWWRGAVLADGTLTWVARIDERVVGVVQLKLVGFANGAHRAEVAKLQVHRAARGRGVAGQLLRHLEAEARRRGRWLLILDTETGSAAEGMYTHWGWQRVGVVADYATTPDGTLTATTFMTKRLR